MWKLSPLGAILACQIGFANCHYNLPSPPAWDDPSEHYLQRTDTITAGAGDASRVNAATHMIDPWPRNVRNKQLSANGQRMVGAIERYRDVSKLPEAPPAISSQSTGFSSSVGGGGGR
ncbi:MAG: hypothetical protein ACTHNN_00850 [Xanthobacteraceae bacterium]